MMASRNYFSLILFSRHGVQAWRSPRARPRRRAAQTPTLRTLLNCLHALDQLVEQNGELEKQIGI